MAQPNIPVAPQGVNYVGKESYEYQLFPEEYFSGADLSIYFGDTWVDELTSLEFGIIEKVRPIFGYASRTWDFVSRGNRLVSGKLRIAFKESGYLNTILSHLGMLSGGNNPVAPKLAFSMHGDSDAPNWYGSCQERIEDILSRYHGGGEQGTEAQGGAQAASLGFKVMAVDRPGQTLKYGDTDGSTGGWVTKAQRAIKDKYSFACLGSMSVSGWPTLKVGSTGSYVKKLQERLKKYWCDPGAVDGVFGNKTREAVITFQRRAKLTQDGIVGDKTKQVLSGGFSIDGSYGPVTTLAVYIVQYEEGLQADGKIGSQTAVKLWPAPTESPAAPAGGGSESICSVQLQIENGKAYAWTRTLASTLGISDSEISYNPSTKIVTMAGKQFQAWKEENGKSWLWTKQVGQAFGWTVTWNNATKCVEFSKSEPGGGSPDEPDSPNEPGPIDPPTTDPGMTAEPRMVQMEQEIWGRRFSPNAEEYNKREPYFYRGEYPSKLRQTGFDIYIVYGPLAQYAMANGGQVGNNAPFNTTVKAIRNIQLKGSEQVLDASGNPIEEIYYFIAQDLD